MTWRAPRPWPFQMASTPPPHDWTGARVQQVSSDEYAIGASTTRAGERTARHVSQPRPVPEHAHGVGRPSSDGATTFEQHPLAPAAALIAASPALLAIWLRHRTRSARNCVWRRGSGERYRSAGFTAFLLDRVEESNPMPLQPIRRPLLWGQIQASNLRQRGSEDLLQGEFCGRSRSLPASRTVGRSPDRLSRMLEYRHKGSRSDNLGPSDNRHRALWPVQKTQADGQLGAQPAHCAGIQQARPERPRKVALAVS